MTTKPTELELARRRAAHAEAKLASQRTCPVATTNERIAEVLKLLDELIEWAEADAESSYDSEAGELQFDDLTRAVNLRMARGIIANCER